VRTKGCDNQGEDPTVSLTIELQPDLEATLRRAAEQAGLPAPEYVAKALRDHLSAQHEVEPANVRSAAATSSLDATEAELLQEINQGLNDDFWERYRALIRSRQDETLSDEDRAELIRLTDQVEAMNASRMEHLAQLARLRGKPLRAVMQELGINPPPYE
jgi:hypothetical protein